MLSYLQERNQKLTVVNLALLLYRVLSHILRYVIYVQATVGVIEKWAKNNKSNKILTFYALCKNSKNSTKLVIKRLAQSRHKISAILRYIMSRNCRSYCALPMNYTTMD